MKTVTFITYHGLKSTMLLMGSSSNTSDWSRLFKTKIWIFCNNFSSDLYSTDKNKHQ